MTLSEKLAKMNHRYSESVKGYYEYDVKEFIRELIRRTKGYDARIPYVIKELAGKNLI